MSNKNPPPRSLWGIDSPFSEKNRKLHHKKKQKNGPIKICANFFAIIYVHFFLSRHIIKKNRQHTTKHKQATHINDACVNTTTFATRNQERHACSHSNHHPSHRRSVRLLLLLPTRCRSWSQVQFVFCRHNRCLGGFLHMQQQIRRLASAGGDALGDHELNLASREALHLCPLFFPSSAFVENSKKKNIRQK
jgi:hypothetical protein